MTITEYFLNAIASGEELNIIYHGGSKPGERRIIIPRSIVGETLKAVDTKYNRVKSFSIKKIEIIDKNNEILKLEFVEVEIDKTPKTPDLTIEQIYQIYKDTFEALGWQVSLLNSVDDYFNQITYIGLYDSFKNGKPKATPTAYMYQSESKHRPFGVGSVRMDTRTYSNLNNALKLFLEEAKNCEIKNPKK